MGDFGTLFPLAIGYFAINGMNPSGLLVMLGIANIVTGIVYRLPMPLQPMKVLAVVAIAQKWPTSRIYASGVATGVIWLILSLTGLVQKLAAITPRSIVRGIQIALGIMLAIEGFKMVSTGWILGAISIVIVLILRTNRYAPAAIVLMVLGIGVVGFKGEFLGVLQPGFTLPPITLFNPIDIWQGLVLAGFAQLPLTATNAVIATSALLNEYFPSRPVSEKKLAEEVRDLARQAIRNLRAVKESEIIIKMTSSLKIMSNKKSELEDMLEELRLIPLILSTKCDICPAL